MLHGLELRNSSRRLQGGLPLGGRDGLLLRLIDRDGRVGRGEVVPLPSFGTEDITDAARVLQLAAAWIAGGKAGMPEAPAEFASWLDGLGLDARSFPAARGGLELALLDLLGQHLGLPVAALLGGAVRPTIPTNALAAGPQAVAQAEAARGSGYGTLKVKVGSLSPVEAVTLAGQVRQAAGREMTLRLDAGRAWEPDETREILPWLARLGIDYLEEPCLDPVLLQEEGLPVALAADESACPVWRGREWLKRSRLPAVFVLKPLVAGGLLPTRQLALDLHARGVRVIITSAFEGQVGLLGAAHLASSLPWEVEPCGFATQAWEEGAAMPPPGFAIPQGPGLGLT